MIFVGTICYLRGLQHSAMKRKPTDNSEVDGRALKGRLAQVRNMTELLQFWEHTFADGRAEV